MVRVLKGTEAELRVTLYQDGDPTDAAGIPTVTITRNGETIVQAGTTEKVAGEVGVYSYRVPPAEVQLGALTATWHATLNGVPQEFTTHALVVGAHTVGLAEIRSLEPLGAAARFPDDRLREARAAAEEALEEACGVAFSARVSVCRIDGLGGHDLLLPVVEARRVLSLEIDGEDVGVDGLEVYPEGVIYRQDGFPVGRRNVRAVVEHGFDVPPARVGHAVKLLCRYLLVDSPVDDRASSFSNEDGTTTTFVTAGVRGAVFSIPEANAVVHQYRVRAGVG